MTWQPIETAPVDTPVLVWLSADGDHFGHLGATAMRAMKCQGVWFSTARGYMAALRANDQPTHWMTLPDGPAESAFDQREAWRIYRATMLGKPMIR